MNRSTRFMWNFLEIIFIKLFLQNLEEVIWMSDALGFLNKNKTRIDQIISEVYNDYNVQHVFINIVDIFNGYHLIYANDESTISFLENKFRAKFIGGVYRENVSMLRKEIKRFLKTSAE